MRQHLLVFIFLFISFEGISQSYPVFGTERSVEITGLTFDAMEPFISPDGNTLFFNSLNSGGNTNLYYATRVNDTVFTFQGLVGGCHDTSSNHLDGVASLDDYGNFFWVSMRDYPTIFQNLHRGIFSGGNVTGITRVYGDINITTLGWIIMDAVINFQGNELVYCNAYFDFINNSCGAGIPCSARLGIAEQANDSTFNKAINTDAIFNAVNDTNYLVYAPHFTNDGLELYYTRLLKGTVNTEICVSVRNNTADPFSQPLMLYSYYGYVPEAPSLTTDKHIMYYHRKDQSGLFHIFLRYRTGSTGISESIQNKLFNISVNFFGNKIIISRKDDPDNFSAEIINSGGQTVLRTKDQKMIDVSTLARGLYLVIIKQGDFVQKERVVLE